MKLSDLINVNPLLLNKLALILHLTLHIEWTSKLYEKNKK